MHIRLAAAILVGAFAAPAVAHADIVIPPVTYPRLAAEGANAQAFVPGGWRLEFTRTGDLNKDGKPDLVLAIRQNDPANVVRHDALGENPFNTNPRILAVAFARAEGGYVLALQNQTLIPRREFPNMEDPFDPNGIQAGGVDVKNGTIRVTLGLFMSVGGWTMGHRTFTFRWQHERFELIGFDNIEVRRNTGDILEVSANFSTGRVKITKSTMETEGPGKVSWVKLPPSELMTVEEAGNGLDFEVPQ